MAESGAVLLIDIGNSRVKWGWGKQGGIEPGDSFATLAALQGFNHHWDDAPPPGRVVVANVAGADICLALQTFSVQRWGLAPRFVCSSAQACGVSNGYTFPEKLGVDRWLALIGARHLGHGPCCIADCGTALTFDALDGAGVHLGGLIAPGLGLMRGALARGTHGLALVESNCQSGLARDTAAAIVAGTRLAAAGLVERAYRETARRLGCQPRLLLTGGDAPSLGEELTLAFELRPHLVLEGLFVIATEH
jgi:type III pantothenate kinase